jgi:hypothetical protein
MRVKPERLSLKQCIDMACARATPVARLGFSWLKSRPIKSDADRTTLTGLANAKCDAVAAEIAEFALSVLGQADAYQTRNVTLFFDSLNAEVRQGAWNWLSTDSVGYDDPALWTNLVESPYDDVKLRLVEELSWRTALKPSPPGRGLGEGALVSSESPSPRRLGGMDLAAIWTTVLLNVHRGNRSKIKALRQISQAIAANPDEAQRLMPVLAVAIRSVRPPEVRAGLSAILSAVAARPELEATLAKWIPELRLSPSGAGT